MGKKVIIALGIVAMLFAFTACEEKTPAPEVIGSWTTPEAVYGIFESGLYSENAEQGEKGAILKVEGKEDTETTGPSTYFGEEDKNLDWDGIEATVSFDLDLSKLEEGQATTWVLAFNQEDYTFIDEIRFGIAKTENGFAVNELTGINHGNIDLDIAAIEAGGKTFTKNEISASFTVSYDKQNKGFTYSMKVGGVTLDGTSRTEPADIVGFRYLWNASASADSSVEISNIVIK